MSPMPEVPEGEEMERGEPSVFAENGTTNPKALFSGAPYIVGPAVFPTTTFPEAEEHVAFDLAGFNNRVVAISDFAAAHGGRNFTKYAFSIDGGFVWVEHYMPTNVPNGLLVTADNRQWDYNSDPVLAVHRSGRVYLVNIYGNGLTNSLDQSNGLYVSRTTWVDRVFTKEQTFPAVVNADFSTRFFGDKPWIAVDNSGGVRDGLVYLSFTRFLDGDNRIRFSRSTNKGQTWSAPIPLSPVEHNGTVQGSQVAVGPEGTVYVWWSRVLADGRHQIWQIRSLDGGVTWRAPHRVSPSFTTLTNFPSKYRVNTFPSAAVSPLDGSLHCVYADQPSFTLGGTLNYIRSADGGVTWSNPVSFNDVETSQQWMPAIAVDETGIVHTAWFDCRNGDGSGRLYDVYASYSKAPGIFSPNARVTPSTFDTGTTNTFVGDYMGIAAQNGVAKPCWNTGGFTPNGRCQTATLVTPP